MFKLFLILLLFTLIAGSSVNIFAKSDNSNSASNSSGRGLSQEVNHGNGNGNNKSNEKEDNQVKNQDSEENEIESTSSGQTSPTCAPEAQWKNHGAFVSCVAHLHQGGKEVSEAARSDIGKKHATSSASLNPSPSSSSSANPSFTPNPSATGSASPSATLGKVEFVRQVFALRELFQDFLKNFKHLLSF